MEGNKEWACIQKKVDILFENDWIEQNEFLIMKGFRNLCENIRHLRQNNGDQQKALEQLNKIKQQEDDQLMQQIKSLGYEKQIEELLQRGYKNVQKLFELLKETDGSLEKALEQKEKQTKLAEEKLLNKIGEKGFEKQNEALVQKGFKNIRKNLYFLDQANGDFELALQQIQTNLITYQKSTEEDCEKRKLINIINEKVQSLKTERAARHDELSSNDSQRHSQKQISQKSSAHNQPQKQPKEKHSLPPQHTPQKQQPQQKPCAITQCASQLFQKCTNLFHNMQNPHQQCALKKEQKKKQKQDDKEKSSCCGSNTKNSKISQNPHQGNPAETQMSISGVQMTIHSQRQQPQNLTGHSSSFLAPQITRQKSQQPTHQCSVASQKQPSQPSQPPQSASQQNFCYTEQQQQQIFQSSSGPYHQQPQTEKQHLQEVPELLEDCKWKITQKWCYKKDADIEKLNKRALEIIEQNPVSQQAYIDFTHYIRSSKPLKFMKLWEKYEGDLQKVITHIEEKKNKLERIKEIQARLPLPQEKICPQKFKAIYFDCNNMIFVEDTIRELATKKKRCTAEKLLIQFILYYCLQVGIPNAHLVFDQTYAQHSLPGQTYSFEQKVRFSIETAQPDFTTADEKLIYLLRHPSSGESSNLQAKNILIVTSDIELTQKICDLGIYSYIKSKDFINHIKKTLDCNLQKRILSGEIPLQLK